MSTVRASVCYLPRMSAHSERGHLARHGISKEAVIVEGRPPRPRLHESLLTGGDVVLAAAVPTWEKEVEKKVSVTHLCLSV